MVDRNADGEDLGDDEEGELSLFTPFHISETTCSFGRA
jgi:hypothetical protein